MHLATGTLLVFQYLLVFCGWPSFLFIYTLPIQGSAKLQDLFDNLLLSKEMESVSTS